MSATGQKRSCGLLPAMLPFARGEAGAILNEFNTFRDLEREGWSDLRRANGYVELFASASDQAIEGLLHAANAGPEMNALDLCCGQGNVSEALSHRGCNVIGVDFSSAMLSFANRRVPSATFIQADAQELPFAREQFDVVVSNLGVCHVPDQPRALSEARRVLRHGGHFAMTVWCGPDVSPCFEIVYGAIKAHGSPEVSAPPGPDFHQFAKKDVAQKILRDAGFTNVDQTIVDCAWDLETPEGLFEIYEKGTVRAAMVLARQPPENLATIRRAMSEAVQSRFANGDRWRVPVPATLVWASS